jgi:hypothetical protein
MTPDTKYLRLSKPAELGDEIDGWRVCWLGGWSKYRIFYLVMLVRCADAYNQSTSGDRS